MAQQLLLHEHYSYSMKFNNIQKLNQATTNCNMAQQQHLQKIQRTFSYWRSLREGQDVSYVAYCEPSHCCMVHANIPTKPASSATSERNFNLICTVTADEIGLNEDSNTTFLVDNSIFETMVMPLSVFMIFFMIFGQDC